MLEFIYFAIEGGLKVFHVTCVFNSRQVLANNTSLKL